MTYALPPRLLHRIIGASALALAGVSLISGCGGSDLEIAPASGTVLYQSKPLEGATVLFTPDSGGRTAKGKTDAEGKFQLTTLKDNDGAVIGKHTVTISKREELPPIEQDPNRPPIPDSRPPAKSLIPEKYSALRETPLKADVTDDSDKNTYKFELND